MENLKITIHAPSNERSRISRLIGDSIYIKACGNRIPEDFIIIQDIPGNKIGIKPVYDYQEAKDLIEKLIKE